MKNEFHSGMESKENKTPSPRPSLMSDLLSSFPGSNLWKYVNDTGVVLGRSLFQALTSLKFRLTLMCSSQTLRTVAKFTSTPLPVLFIMDIGLKEFFGALCFEPPEELHGFMKSQLRKEIQKGLNQDLL